MLASMNRCRIANFAHGFLLHEGKNIERNIEEAIHYYKEASSFNIQFAKNNLGIIYKHGYDNAEGRAGNAIVYFEEAIRQKNDYLSMYNLAHIYIYDDTIKGDIDKSIELLVKSSNKFSHSMILLLLVLIKQYGFNIEKIEQEIEKRTHNQPNLSNKVYKFLNFFLNESIFNIYYEEYKHTDFVYNILLQPVPSPDLKKKYEHVIAPKYPNAKNITNAFYDGLGYDIYNKYLD